jgi:hypothetical protein
MTDLPSTELGMANEDAIARATKTLTFKKWSVLSYNSVLQYGCMHFKKVVDDAERLEVENKLIARICLASKNSKKQALQKKQSQEDNKNNLKNTRCSPNDSPEMVAEKFSRTYRNWLLTRMVQAWMTHFVTPITLPRVVLLYLLTYNELVTARVHPQHHKQPKNTTTMVMEPLTPPVAWIR